MLLPETLPGSESGSQREQNRAERGSGKRRGMSPDCIMTSEWNDGEGELVSGDGDRSEE
jgi:hypothetical protein